MSIKREYGRDVDIVALNERDRMRLRKEHEGVGLGLWVIYFFINFFHKIIIEKYKKGINVISRLIETIHQTKSKDRDGPSTKQKIEIKHKILINHRDDFSNCF